MEVNNVVVILCRGVYHFGRVTAVMALPGQANPHPGFEVTLYGSSGTVKTKYGKVTWDTVWFDKVEPCLLKIPATVVPTEAGYKWFEDADNCTAAVRWAQTQNLTDMNA